MRTTHSQGILEKLAHAIVTGAVAPGQKLEEQALANEFAVSRTPVREALRQLNGMGLVELRPRGGVTVARIAVAQLADMFEALGELEGVCAKFSANRMSEVERQKLRILVEKGADAVGANELAEYARLNEQVHDLIYQGAHNASILQTTQSFRKRLAPFRVPTFHMIGERMHSSLREHQEILAAIVDGDGNQACQAMRSHVASSSVSVIEYFEMVRTETIPSAAQTTSGKGVMNLPTLDSDV